MKLFRRYCSSVFSLRNMSTTDENSLKGGGTILVDIRNYRRNCERRI